MTKKKSGTRKSKPRAGGALSFMSIPPECFVGMPYMELHGDSSLHISGYESLVRYEDGEVVFRMRKTDRVDCHFLRILGEGLLLHALREGVLSVSGRIDAIILRPAKVLVQRGERS